MKTNHGNKNKENFTVVQQCGVIRPRLSHCFYFIDQCGRLVSSCG